MKNRVTIWFCNHTPGHIPWENHKQKDSDLLSNSKTPQIVLFYFLLFCCCCLVAQSLATLRGPMDCSPSGSSVHGILQARILECVAISSSKGSSWPRDQTWVSCLLIPNSQYSPFPQQPQSVLYVSTVDFTLSFRVCFWVIQCEVKEYKINQC